VNAPPEELVDLIDEHDVVQGRVTRKQMRAGTLWHRSVAILCRNSMGAIYVHKRTTTKDVFPGLYDMFVGGVVSAGETYAQAALREIGEELGIVGPQPTPLFHHRYAGPSSRAHIEVFEVIWDGVITLQASEVAWGAFRSQQEIVDNREGWTFVPDGAEIFDRYCALAPR
jgi:8-oxo-dGTP pyrophosphatase MutT (NUDIX family)